MLGGHPFIFQVLLFDVAGLDVVVLFDHRCKCDDDKVLLKSLPTMVGNDLSL